MNNNKQFNIDNITKDQAKDTGMAMVLICMIVSIISESDKFQILALAILILNMIVPGIFKFVASLWLKMSFYVGTIVSKIILTILYFLLITPVGLLRKLIGKDTLNRNKWKKDVNTIFKKRNHKYEKSDMENPY